MVDIKEKLKLLPKSPGCYLMKNSDGEIIYVGKAKNLSNRVKSYFTGIHNAKTEKLVENIVDFEYIMTNSDTEAYLLEINLIKENHPKYNIMLMDDKTYPYIYFTDEAHPRLIVTRDPARFKKRVKGALFGPYPNATSAKNIVEILNKMYPLRKCNTIPKKPCLYYSLGQCLAPCIKTIDKHQYDSIKEEISTLLKSPNSVVYKKIQNMMVDASDNLDFEKAIMYRDMLNDLDNLFSNQKMTSTDLGNRDVFGYSVNNGLINIQVFHIRFGKVIMRSGDLFEIIDDSNEQINDALTSYILQFYNLSSNILPNEVVIPYIEDIEVLKDQLDVRITIPIKGAKKHLVDLVCENASNTLENNNKLRLKKIEKTKEPLVELSKILNIKYPKRIELFDNSNIMGTSAVSGMVVYIDGVPSYRDYRKYKVKEVVGADDYHTMMEILNRRYSRALKEGTVLPNLLIVDGGVPQVKAAKQIFENLNLTSVDIMGLVKDDNHRTRAIVDKNLNEIEIDKHSDLFLLLEAMQDEVHRFAITYFRKTKRKEMTSSILDSIEGVGKTRKQMLQREFSSLDEIKNAKREKLKSMGFSDKVIYNIYKALEVLNEDN